MDFCIAQDGRKANGRMSELAKATREKLREAHNELHEVIGYLHKREQRLEDARSRLALYEVWDDSVPPGGYVCAACGAPVESEPCAEHWKGSEAQCVGCTTEAFDGAPGSVKLNADATCPVHGEPGPDGSAS